MASQRLLVSDKVAIRNALLQRAFEPKEEQLARAREEMGDLLYVEVLGEHRKAIESLPEGWLAEQQNVEVRFGDSRHDSVNLPLSRARRFPDTFEATLPPDHALAKPVFALEKRAERLRKEKKAARVQIDQVLNQATTLARLKELWPEAASLIDEALGTSQDKLPLPVISNLNKTLGLPPDGQE